MSRKPLSFLSLAALALVLWMGGSTVSNAQMLHGGFHGGHFHHGFVHQRFFHSFRPFFAAHGFFRPFAPFRVVRVWVLTPFPHWAFQRVYLAPPVGPVCSSY